MPKKIQSLAILATLLIVLFLVPYLALAADLFEPPDIGAGIATALNLFFGPGAEEYTSEPIKILQSLIFPFIALWTVLYGILTNLRIFGYRREFNALLSFLMAVIACPTGGLIWLVHWSFVVMGAYGFVAFLVLFGAGVFFWAVGGTAGYYREFKSSLNKANRLRKEIQEIRKEIRDVEAVGGDSSGLRQALSKKSNELGKVEKDVEKRTHRHGF